MPTTPLKIVVLISGNGSNLQAIIDAIANGLPAKICAVISNRPEAYGLERATQAHIPNHTISLKDFPSYHEYNLAMQQQVDPLQPDLIVLAGFMQMLSPEIVQHWGTGRILNLHPSLLPKYPGLHTHQRVLEAQEKQHGVSVHFVTKDLDGGPIIAQMAVNVRSEDTIDSLAIRIQALEHQLYPKVIEWFAQGRVQLVNDRVYFDNQELPENGYNKLT